MFFLAARLKSNAAAISAASNYALTNEEYRLENRTY
jgi:hypothetical protein